MSEHFAGQSAQYGLAGLSGICLTSLRCMSPFVLAREKYMTLKLDRNYFNRRTISIYRNVRRQLNKKGYFYSIPEKHYESRLLNDRSEGTYCSRVVQSFPGLFSFNIRW